MHDLLLCGVDPSMVDLTMCLANLKSEDSHAYRETEALIRTASRPWMPSRHTFLYGPEFRACIASMCLVKVTVMLFFGQFDYTNRSVTLERSLI